MILDYKFVIFSFIFIDLQSSKVEIPKLKVFSFLVFLYSVKVLKHAYLIRLKSD